VSILTVRGPVVIGGATKAGEQTSAIGRPVAGLLP